MHSAVIQRVRIQGLFFRSEKCVILTSNRLTNWRQARRFNPAFELVPVRMIRLAMPWDACPEHGEISAGEIRLPVDRGR